MNEVYTVKNSDEIYSPGLLIFRELLDHNLAEMVRIAGSPERLRPHCKTHKTREIVKIQMEMGITRHKCATIAEAEMLAGADVEDILLAYQLVGPNPKRMAQLLDKFPNVRFASLVDCPSALDALSDAVVSTGSKGEVGVLLDLNSGMNRTGIQPGPDAIQLYEMIASSPGIRPDGLHWYDGHQRESDIDLRRGSVLAGWDQFTRFRDQLQLTGLPIPQIVAAGTGSFPILAEVGEPNLQLSPGTTTYFDTGYQERFPEMAFRPALGILTRVVSRTGGRQVTFDVGHKSCAADQPAGNRLTFPTIPDAREISHTEEHLVIETEQVDQLKVGDAVVALPRHACPASAVHQIAHVVSDGQVVDRWTIAARDRILTV